MIICLLIISITWIIRLRRTDRSLGFLLNDAARLLRRDFDRRARALGLTRAQWSVLAHLARYEGTNQAALADILELQPITLTRLLDRLEAAGWIERRHDPDDRRVWVLYLAPKAHPLLAQLYRLGAQTRAVALRGFAAREREILLDLLARMRTNLSASDQAPADSDDRVVAIPLRERSRHG